MTGWAGRRWNARVIEVTGPLLIIGGGILAVVVMCRGNPSNWLCVLPAHLPAFGAGMLLAVLDVLLPRELSFRARKIGASRTLWWGLAVLLFLLVPLLAGARPGQAVKPAELVWQHLLRAVIGTAVLVPIALGRRQPQAASGIGVRLMVFLGTVSYGIYLWHYPLLGLIQRELFGWPMFTGNWPALVLVALPCVLACATASWFLVESPAIRLSDRLAPSGVDRHQAARGLA